MLASITPLGERSRNQRWGVTVSAHAVGGLVGGAAVGSLLALAGTSLPAGATWRLVAFAALLLVCAAVDLNDPPTHRRQVDELWLRRYRGWVYGGGFGLQLGAGFLTIVTSAIVYGTFAGALLSGSPARGAVVGAVFGLARGMTPSLTRGIDSPAKLAAFHRGLVRHARTAAAATVLAQAAVGLGALAQVLS
jgi:sulfite exporter TauE/SafE